MVKVYERGGKSVIAVCEGTSEGCHLPSAFQKWLRKGHENFLVLRFVYILKTAHLQKCGGCDPNFPR